VPDPVPNPTKNGIKKSKKKKKKKDSNFQGNNDADSGKNFVLTFFILKTVLNMVWIRIQNGCTGFETFPKWEPELESTVSVFTTLTP
jgi:hypothetical protein